MLATNVGALCAATAMRVLMDYMQRTDKATAMEAMRLAIDVTPNPFEVPKVEPEIEGMYYFKALLEITLEACTKRALESDE